MAVLIEASVVVFSAFFSWLPKKCQKNGKLNIFLLPVKLPGP